MKIFNTFRPSRIIKKTLVENPISKKVSLTTGEDILDLSTKQTKKPSKLQGIKTAIQKNLIGLDKATIKKLEALTFGEFAIESQKIMAKSMGLPQDFLPSIISQPLDKKIGAVFDKTQNIIAINSEHTKRIDKQRILLFTWLRHEMEHYKQNLSILRTEGLGDKAIESYSSIVTKHKVQTFINTLKDMPDKTIQQWVQEGKLPEKATPIIKELKDVSTQGDEAVSKFSEKIYNNDYPIWLQQWKNLRDKIIEKLGPIKEGTEDAKMAQKYYDGFEETAGLCEGKKYKDSQHEKEAYGAQYLAQIEYAFKKLFG